MNQIANTRFTFLTRAKMCTITPALVLALGAGIAAPVVAQDMGDDSGAFGLMQAFTKQGQEAAMEDGFDGYGEEVVGEGAPVLDDDGIAGLAGEVEVSEYDLVDLHVNNEDLGNILQLLSIQSQRNIISSNTVQATVTADLYGVTFYEALDSILNVNGFGYIEKGNFIYVYTREELEEFERATRRPISRILHLDYLNSADAAEFAKELLSESGSISTHAATAAFQISEGAPAGADTYASSASIVIHDFEEQVEEIMSLLMELDTKPTQVLVEATILQTSLNEANAFGVDFALIKNLNFTDFVGSGGPLSVIDGLIGGKGQLVDGTNVAVPNGGGDVSGVSSNVGNTSGPATLKAGLVNGDVAVFMRVLDEVTDVTIVSNPKILTLNRQPARVLVGTRVGYLSTTSTTTATTQTVQFLEVGTELAVRPFVSQTGLIRLELRPQVSSFKLRSLTDNTGSTVTIPDEDTTEMTTNVMVRDGQTVVLGGLFTETTTATRRQVPLLGNIPMIGQAFRGNDDSTRRSEIIFLITPSIVNDTILAETGNRGNEFVEHARFGARKGLLPWSRERRIGQILIDARRHADNGNTEKALAKIDQALRLQPNSPDARAMRAELTGEMSQAPSRAMIQSIIHGELLNQGSGAFHLSEKIDPVAEASPLDGVAWPAPEVDGLGLDSSESEFDSGTEDGSEEVAEVFEPVSDASESVDGAEEFMMESEVAQPEEVATYTEIIDPGIESGYESGIEGEEFEEASFDVAESEMDSAMDSEMNGEMEYSEIASETPFEGTGEGMGSFDLETFDPGPFIEEVAGADVLPEDFSEAQWDEFGYEEIVPGIAIEQEFASISGQLIISLPGGGALQLDWPLSASDWTSANATDSEDVSGEAEMADGGDELEIVEDGSDSSETVFTEVPSGDFE